MAETLDVFGQLLFAHNQRLGDEVVNDLVDDVVADDDELMAQLDEV